MKTNDVLDMVRSHCEIRCSTICKNLNMKQNVVAGILSALKHRGLVYNNGGFWYVINDTPIVKKVKLKLLDINNGDNDMAWCEGYLSALCDHEIIDERGFEYLMNWLKQ